MSFFSASARRDQAPGRVGPRAMARSLNLVLLACVAVVARPPAALSAPRIAASPPSFRIYDVDARERRMRRLLGQMEGSAALSRPQAIAALAELDRIQREEQELRARNGGRLTVPVIRVVDARLNALARRVGLREPAY